MRHEVADSRPSILLLTTVLNYVARARTPFVNVRISVLTSSCTDLKNAVVERRCATVADMSNTPPP